MSRHGSRSRHPITADSRTPQELREAAEQRIARVLIGLGLGVMIVIQLVPFYITLTTALKHKTDLSSQWVPPTQGFAWDNFTAAIAQGHILVAIGNSAIVTVVGTVLVCVLSALAAYPLARRLSKANAAISFGFIGLMMVPPLSILVPLYSMMASFHGLNTYWGIILVMVAGNIPISVFLYTAFIRSLPTSIEEVATVDGARMWQVLLHIVVPMLKPVTATVVILTSVNIWNEFALSGFFLTSPDRRTIAPAIASFFGGQSDLGAAAAASLLSVIPVLLVYLLLQKYFIKGMVAGAVK
ncbi:carbohydrate ABC transporter permease [Microbacterium kribbense]|uniref:Carbohydrate ABC transporter permease n=1 Tax=Microbacterium kribbense TaxID=433645 RepID=A0ABP7G7S7_9MICO